MSDRSPKQLRGGDVPSSTSGSLVEIVCHLQHDQRRRWERGERVLVEEYLSDDALASATPDDILDLIYHEVMVREEYGEQPELAEYLARFPQFTGPIRDQFEVHQALKLDQWLGEAGTREISHDSPLASRVLVGFGAQPSIPGYEVIRELGRGGMGVVYLARQTGLQRLVALKMILAAEYSRPRDRERFRREAEAVARLEHPNLVKIYETGENDSRPYFSMEYVEGGRLSDSLRGTPVPPRRAAQLVETLARATHAAHERGVIHRDLTPSNVLLTAEGEPKIVDFGLAKLTQSGTRRTATGDILGTPSYMAPEQATGQSKEVGPAADVYALGAILYDLLTGRPPFKGESLLATLAQVVNDHPVTPSRLQPKIPRDLENVCLKCLNKEPARRYESARKLADDLARFTAGEPVRARPISAISRAARWARRQPAVALLLALCTAGAIASFAVVAWKEHTAELAQRHAEAAQKAEEAHRTAAETARESEAQQRRLYQGLSAILLRDRALSHCDDGDVGRGLLWLAESMNLVPDNHPDLERALRTNLAGWLWQVHPLKAMLGHSDRILAAGWSPDGRLILTSGADREARLWDASGSPRGPAFRLPRAATTASFSPDSGTILAVAGSEIRLWKTAAGGAAAHQTLDLGDKAQLLSHVFSRDGEQLWTACRHGPMARLQCWRTGSGQRVGNEIELGRAITLVVFSPDAQSLVAAGESREARAHLYRTAGGKPVRDLNEHTNRVAAIAFDPVDGKTFITGSTDQTCRLWNTATGEPLTTIIQHAGAVRSVAFSPSGRQLLIGGHDRIAQLWDLERQRPVGAPMHHPDAVTAVRFSASGDLALTVSWDQVRLWDARTGELLGAPLPHQREVLDASFSPDDRSVLTRSRDSAVRIWSTAPARPSGRRLKHKGWVTAVAFHPTAGDSFLTGIGGSEGKALCWSTTSDREPSVAIENVGPILSLAFRPDGQLFAVGTRERKVWVHRAGASPSARAQPLALDDRVWSVAFSPDGQTLLTGIEKSRADFWDLASSKRSAGTLRHEKAVYAVAYSPDGRTVATGSEDATAQLWDAATHRPLGITLLHQGTVYAVAFQPPDGRLILTGSDDRTARLWQSATGLPTGQPLRHPARVLAVAFSPDGRIIATGCGDGAARLWDAQTGHPIGRPLLHRGPVRAVTFGPNPQSASTEAEPWILVTGSEDMTARIWEVPLPRSDSTQRLMRSIEVASGLVLDDQSVADSLTTTSWQDKRRSLGEPQ
jgi:WD40 repeat protein/predicted Ser/Thr protein kinase